MGFFTSIIELLARFFLSIVFFINGVFKSTYYEETVEYMLDFNIPAILAIPTIIFEMIFPLFIVVGYKTRISASALFLFCIATAVIFHSDFSNQVQNSKIARGFYHDERPPKHRLWMAASIGKKYRSKIIIGIY